MGRPFVNIRYCDASSILTESDVPADGSPREQGTISDPKTGTTIAVEVANRSTNARTDATGPGTRYDGWVIIAPIHQTMRNAVSPPSPRRDLFESASKRGVTVALELESV